MTIHSTLLATAVLAVLSTASAQAAQPLRVAAGDQIPAGLVAAPLLADESEHAPLAFAWALDPAQPLQAPGPQAAISRSYWQQVDGAELQRGLELPLSAPDAVIQLSPAPGARALPASALQVRDPAGRSSVARSVDARQLQDAGMPVGDGSSMLRTGTTSAAGAYRLQSAQAQGRYVVQVLEPNSPLRLEVQASQAQVLAGGNVQLQARLLEDGASAATLRARRGSLGGEALLVAPDGRSWPQRLLRTTDGSLRAQVRIPAEASNAQGLWELQVFAQADGVLRDGKVAFAVARPTARFAGEAMPDPGSRRVSLPLQVAAAGRYEARGTLYATAANGQLQPVAQAHAAAWFDGPGRGALVLPFDQAALPAGFGAPYELRDLQLQDQSRMAPIESRALALRF
ncbi:MULTISPECIES: DUF4785 domain-containing protein [Stenotrophomonas]|uniref:DUF4785 family protein n=1 Tax=Stenotrophomonas lactitubi TaxID=2045214 RepID=A0AAW4GI97_9GAMM|nr:MULTISPECIES: DUF4785 domain-containing protein [Stenotrophomonas]MBM9913596.1 DUF4785 family protein [Stenotrophomonas lactitubi]MBM9921472.1 DUF4785 family protein [Stenotrophomonas lactitubi]MBM9938624.1 DUF4785 family protein [Stenotrophomonas lactitubi]